MRVFPYSCRLALLQIAVLAALWMQPLAARANTVDLGTVPPSGPIAVPAPDLDGEVWIEIGTVDVTAWAILDGDTIRLAGFAPLSVGAHIVTIYAVKGEGYEIVSRFTVNVVAGGELRHRGLFKVTAQTDSAQDPVVADVAGELSGQTASGSIAGEATYRGGTAPPFQPDGRFIDLQDYNVAFSHSAEIGAFTSHFGHQKLSEGTLLLDDQDRRGISSAFTREDGRFSVKAFSLQASSTTGSDNLTGLRDADDRLSGLQSIWTPSDAIDLSFAVELYEGRGETYFFDGIGSGEGVAVSLFGSARSGALQFGLSAARAGWDDDAEEDVFSTLTGNAFSGYLTYQLPTADDATRSSVGLEISLVDYYFFSLANPFEAAGLERYTFNYDRIADRNSQRFSVSLQIDDRNAPEIVPQNRIWEASFDGDWTPRTDNTGLTFTYGLSYLQQDRIQTPDNAPPPQDYSAFSAYVGASGTRHRTGWSAELRYIDENDRTPENADKTSVILDLGGQHAFSDRLSAEMELSLSHVQQTNGPDIGLADVSLGVDWRVIPDRWTLGLGIDASFTDGPFFDDGSAIVLTSTHHVTDRLEIDLSVTRETGSFAKFGQADTTAALMFRVPLDAPRR